MNFSIILMNAAEQTQKTGLWQSFVSFLGTILEGLNKVTGAIPEPFGGYGLAIILFTILMRFVLLPLDIKSRKANQKMQEIQPLINEINQKYKNDPDKRNKKTMELYQKYEVNPLGGCLPLLIQMPLFFALLGALNALSAREVASGSIQQFLWIKNIWYADSPLVSKVGQAISFLGPDYNGLLILPVLAGVTSYYQIKMSQPQGDNQQMKGFTTIMPIMSVIFCYKYTASFAIYWITSNLFQIVQQLIFKKVFRPQVKEGDKK